jgi:virulence-associated protein VapD
MFAIAYDLTVADAEHPRGQAYLDIASTLRKFGFERVQRSVFASKDNDLASLFRAEGIGVVRTECDEYSCIPN